MRTKPKRQENNLLALRNFPIRNNPERNIPKRNNPERNIPKRNNPEHT